MKTPRRSRLAPRRVGSMALRGRVRGRQDHRVGRPRMIRLVSWVLLTGPLAFAGCGDTTEPPAPRPAAVAVTPSTAEIPALGQTVQLTAEVRDQDGQPMPSARWHGRATRLRWRRWTVEGW